MQKVCVQLVNYASRYWDARQAVQWQLIEAGSTVANINAQNAWQEESALMEVAQKTARR